MFIFDSVWFQKYILTSPMRKRQVAFSQVHKGKKLSLVKNLPLQSVMKYDSFCFGVDFLVIYWSRGEIKCDTELKEKRGIVTAQTSVQMPFEKIMQKTVQTCMKWKIVLFFNISPWYFWSKCQHTFHYMRRPFSLRLNVNTRRGNALQFY